MNDLEIVRRRMATQGLSAGRSGSAAAVVRRLGAMQAQEFAEAKWSLAQRMEGEPTDAEIEESFARGEILRTHVLRPTWHFVAPEDLRWMLRLTAPRVHQASRPQYRANELDDGILARTDEILRETLSDGEPRTRRELGEALAARGVEATGSRLAYISTHAELEAVVCSGPRRGRQHTYRLVDDLVPPQPERDRDDALAELARRYFGGHGPASIRDFAWWSGLKISDCRAAVELAREDLEEIAGDDRSWWSGPRPARVPRRTGADLIATYDELIVAFQDLRLAYAGEARMDPFERPLLIDGVCAGTWRRALARDRVDVQVTTFGDIGGAAGAAVTSAVERFGRFLGLPVNLRQASR